MVLEFRTRAFRRLPQSPLPVGAVCSPQSMPMERKREREREETKKEKGHGEAKKKKKGGGPWGDRTRGLRVISTTL